MIKKFTNVNDLNKVLRKYLISQSELSSKNVLNSLSIYGENLNKIFNNIATSYKTNDCVLLFELSNRQNTSNISFTENNSIIYTQSYKLKIILYGENGADICNKIIARFRTERVRNLLYDEGIYIEKIDNPISFNEFKNDVMWPRNDFNIDLSCEFIYSQVEQDNYMQSISDLKIINK